MKYAYYPGCTLETAAREYDVSARAVFRELGAELVPIPDWNCCGSSPAESVDYLLSIALPARNLALAEQMGLDIVATCSSCYLSLFKVEKHCQRDPSLRPRLAEILGAAGLTYRGTVRVRHMLDVIANDIGPEKVQARMRRSLRGLRVVPYYGCQTVRPFMEYDGPDLPESMDRLLAAMEADVVPYLYKTRCCGGILITSTKDVGIKLVSDLLAETDGADCVVTVCPLCQMNLDAYQAEVSRKLGRRVNIPVLYLTQLMALAFDLPAQEILLQKNIVSPRPVLEKIGWPAGS
jgi:heterodisulfide reductase subunit B